MQTHERDRNGTPGQNNPSKSKMEGEGKIFPILLAPSSVVADIEIAQATKMRPIVDVAKDLGLSRDDLILKSDVVAKVKLAAIDRVRKGRQGKFVLVTGTTPTRYGEGKTLTTVGLGQALNRLGTKGIVAVREPSLGPVFGTKGGATGGGRAQVLPMEEINLHFTGDIHAVGAANNLTAAILLKDALMPNLVQTLEGTPALVHGGPFANIAHGHNSVLADRLALGLGDIVVAEAGFGADLGAEKFVDLVCRESGLRPDAAVLVVSIRALKHHGGAKRKDLAVENPKVLQAGMVNLDAHVRILQTLGMTPVVAVNRFMADTDREVDAVVDHCKDLGVRAAAHTFHEDGGAGGEELARLVVDATKASTHAVRFAYKDADAFEEKVAKVATSVYGAAAVKYDAAALEDLERLRAAGLDGLPVCIAKTQLSLSDDERALGAPTGWTLQVRGIRPSAGAGVLVAVGDLLSARWFWAAIITLIVLAGLMTPLAAVPYNRVRTILGLPRPLRRRRPAAAADGGTGDLNEALSNISPYPAAIVGFLGLGFLLYLMLFKPF